MSGPGGGEEGHCANCGRRITWHPVGQAYIHGDLGHWWCDPQQQGYGRPKATPRVTPPIGRSGDAGAHDDTRIEGQA